ncbi:MAG: redoxin domain-containing protein [Bacteroidia bacterium]
MKKIFLSLVMMIGLAANSSAQTTLTQAVDFTVTDVDGHQHSLFSLLNAGKYVCLDFFFVACPPCQTTSPYYKQAYNNYGCNQYDVFFMAVDVGDNTAAVQQFEQTYLGGPAGYPVISGTDGGGDAVIAAYNIGAFPTYILIAPNGTIVEQDMWPINNAASFTTYLSAYTLQQNPCITGIVENTSTFDVNLYPNPASDFITVSTEKSLIQYSVVDMAGRVVLEGFFTEGQPPVVPVGGLSYGSYVLQLSTNDGQVQRSRFMKN